VADVRVEPFTIQVADDVLADLLARISNARWPDDAPGEAWSQGTDLGYLRALTGYWANAFDWRAQERRLNGFRQFHTDVDGARIHFVHERARRGAGLPLILTHGWPSTFAEYLPLVPLLTDPEAHGIGGPAFDIVIPSLPGYGFSERPARTGVTTRDTARRWHSLMHGLGYERYGAAGGDFGAGVTTYLALDEPAAVRGIYLTTPEVPPYTGPDARPMSGAEQAYLAQIQHWAESERGYSAIQSTKPQTLGYALNDSPVGLAAWIVEKWRSWTDSGGDVDAYLTRDFLLTTVTLYWITGTITASMRDYFDNRWSGTPIGPDEFVDVPTAIAVFANHFVDEGEPPREWAERLYNVRRWTQMPRGGHFAAVERPETVARDIAAFFAQL
jgi:pimeloyl-ACP methyl ester carboxylesterase